MDAAYLEATVSQALVSGLAATVEFQPEDSVDFLGKFLIKYAETLAAKAKLAEEDAQAEVDAKEAASKVAASQEVAAAAAAAAGAKASAEQALVDKLASAPVVDDALMTQLLDYIQSSTAATGAYVGVKEGGGEGEGEEDGPKATLRYIGASKDHAFMLQNSVTQPSGATFPVWIRPPQEEVEDDVDEEGNPKPKPPPPELQPLHVTNVLRHASVEFFRVPRLGAYLAVPFEYQSLTHADAIPPPGEETKAADGDGDGGDGDGDSKAADGDSKTAEKPEVPPGRPKLTAAAICLDTLGQNRAFTPSQIECVSAWAKRLASAMNRSEQALYIVKYKKHVADLAEAAARAEADAKAAEEAAKAAADAAAADGDAATD